MPQAPPPQRGSTTFSRATTSRMLKRERYARSSEFPPTLTRPAPGETDHDHGEPTTVHQPPVPALPQPLVTVRWKPSEAGDPGGWQPVSAVTAINAATTTRTERS